MFCILLTFRLYKSQNNNNKNNNNEDFERKFNDSDFNEQSQDIYSDICIICFHGAFLSTRFSTVLLSDLDTVDIGLHMCLNSTTSVVQKLFFSDIFFQSNLVKRWTCIAILAYCVVPILTFYQYSSFVFLTGTVHYWSKKLSPYLRDSARCEWCHSRSIKVIRCCANRRGIYDFLLALNSNLTSVFNRSANDVRPLKAKIVNYRKS